MSDSHTQLHPIFKIWCAILGLALLATGLFYVIGGVSSSVSVVLGTSCLQGFS